MVCAKTSPFTSYMFPLKAYNTSFFVFLALENAFKSIPSTLPARHKYPNLTTKIKRKRKNIKVKTLATTFLFLFNISLFINCFTLAFIQKQLDDYFCITIILLLLYSNPSCAATSCMFSKETNSLTFMVKLSFIFC